MKKLVLFSFAMALVFISCKKATEDTSSSLFVEVFGYNGYPLEDAIVFTVPATETLYTDSYGMVTFTNIPTGVYDVYAVYDNYGSGKKSIQVEVNSGNEAEINVEYGHFPDFYPQIMVVSPEASSSNTYVFSQKDPVSFVLNVLNGVPGHNIVWKSDLDGEVGASIINNDLSSSITLRNLSVGTHDFTLTTVGEDGIDCMKTIRVQTDGPSSIILYPLVVESFDLRLTWSYYVGNNFSNYKIYLKEYSDDGNSYESVIKTIEGEWDTTVLVPIHNSSYCEYRVKVTTTDYSILPSSNVESFEKGYFGNSFDYYPEDMVLHQYKDYVYVFYSDKVVLYDYANKNVIASRAIADIGYYHDITYSNNEATIFLGSDMRVYILDGEDLTLTKTVNFPNEVKSVAVVSPDLIFASVAEDYNSYNIYSYSLGQQKIIDSIGWDGSYRYLINRVPISNKLVVESDDYNGKFKYLYYSVDGQINGFGPAVSPNQYNFNGYPLSFSPNGSYFIPLRTTSRVYSTGESISMVGTLSNNHQFRDFTFSESGDTIYSIESDYGHFITYTYPAMDVVDEVDTDVFYAFTEKKEDAFYSLVRSQDGYAYYFVAMRPH